MPAVEYKTVFHAKLQIVLIQPALSAINAMIISTSATTPASAVEYKIVIHVNVLIIVFNA